MAANSDVVVVMVPYPEYGHLLPSLRLSQLISSYNIPVHYVSFASRNHELRQRQQGGQFTNIQFHDLSVSSNYDEEDYHSYWETFKQISESLCEICRTLYSTGNYKRVVVIHDAVIQTFVECLYSTSFNYVETYFFHAFPAFTMYSLYKQVSDEEGDNNRYNDGFFSTLKAHMPSMDTSFKSEMKEFTKVLRDCKFKSGDIFNTCRVLEGPYLDALSKQSVTPVWGLGPLDRVHVFSDDKESCKSHRCIQWLDKQPLNSVIFVSFGTANTFSIEQIHMIAMGLERSEQKFIWVLREADKKTGDNVSGVNPKIELPIGFEERVSGRGIIERGWVPQSKILAHPSTGGYFFHSGWNSFLESAIMGVPMATWPLNVDNPINDVLITKVLKVGLVVRDWADRDELVKAEKIEVAVRTLMNSPEGEEFRQRAIELSKAIKMSIGDGGSTQKEMNSFIAHITR